jgi:hypothetical protein
LYLDNREGHKSGNEIRTIAITPEQRAADSRFVCDRSIGSAVFWSRRTFSYHQPMRRAGFLLLLAGWSVLVIAIAVFSGNVSRYIFVIAGLLVELLGLALVALDLRQPAGERE